MSPSPRVRDGSRGSRDDGGAREACPPLTIARGRPQPREPRRPLALTALDACSLVAFAALVYALGRRVAGASAESGALGVLVASAVLGYLGADLVSGTVHWFGDTFFAEDTPLIGDAFIRPFREHHRDPLAITRHGFLEVNGNNCLALMPLLVPAWLLGEPDAGDGSVPWLWLQASALFFALTTFGTNQVHKWAHLPSPPSGPIRWLQAHGVILSPVHHAAHHRPPHSSTFCVTVGWMNPVLDRLGLFERAERAVRGIGARRRPASDRTPTPTRSPGSGHDATRRPSRVA